MAFALEQDAVFAYVQFQDDQNDIKERKMHLRWDTDLATTIANAATLAGLLAAVSDSKVGKLTISLSYEDAAASGPAAGAQVERLGVLRFVLVTDPPTALQTSGRFSIPAPADSIRVASSGRAANDIDTTDADVVALRNAFMSGGTHLAYLSHGQDVDSLSDGYIKHAGSKRG